MSHLDAGDQRERGYNRSEEPWACALVADLHLIASDGGGHAALLDAALAVPVPRGGPDVKGKPLSTVASDRAAERWLRWAISKPDGFWPTDFERALWTVTGELFPSAAADVLAGEGRCAA